LTGGFVDHDDLGRLEDDLEGRIGRGDGRTVGHLGHVDPDDVSASHRAAFRHAAPVDAHGTELDGALHPCAAELRKELGDGLVEPRTVERLRNGELPSVAGQ
jgi:hypothetical protein